MSRLTQLFTRRASGASKTLTAARPKLEVLEDRTVPSFVAAAFPDQGVWRYDTAAATWQQLTANNSATQLAADSGGDVVAEFAGQGVWLYHGFWQEITANNASVLDLGYTSVFRGPNIGQQTSIFVVAEFPGQGLWRYTNVVSNTFFNIGWTEITTNNASHAAIDNNGNVVAEFPGQGVWFNTNGGDWRQLTASDASSLAIGATPAGTSFVAASFPGYGVWRIQDGGGWVQLTANFTITLSIGANGDVVGEFQGSGVWSFLDSTAAATAGWGKGWNHLTAADATLVGIDANGNFVGQFAGSGIWYDNVGFWQHVRTDNATLLDVGS
jgi:hypothetical protein